MPLVATAEIKSPPSAPLFAQLKPGASVAAYMLPSESARRPWIIQSSEEREWDILNIKRWGEFDSSPPQMGYRIII